MKEIAALFLRALPLDARGRRAIDETLADWAHEDERPGSWGLRIARSCRAALSIVRVLIGVTAWEAMHVPFGWLAGRLVFLALVPAPFFSLASLRALSFGLGAPLPDSEAFLVLSSLGTALLLLPLACFYSLAWPPRGRSVPVLGSAVWSLVLALAIGGWVLPHVNQSYRDLAFGAGGSAGPLVPRPSELTLPELASAAIANSYFGAARASFVTKTGLYALCPALVLLAAALAGASQRRRRMWFAAIPAAFLLSAYFSTILIASGGRMVAPQLRYVGGLSLWCLVTVSVVAALRINARRPAPAPVPQLRQSVPSAP
jgi:hypothetical protein